MATYPLVRRFALIMEKVQNSNYPSLHELMEYLRPYGFEYCDRTLNRYILRIREDFQVEITYNEKERGYFIDESLSDDLEGFVRYLEMANTADLISQSLRETREGLKYLQFDAHGSLRGVEMLKPLLRSIIDNKKVAFVHENYLAATYTSYVVEPYLLKEYLNRWYLVAFVENLGEFLTFGVDRLHELQVTDQKFTYDFGKDPQRLFRNVVGLDYSNQKTETVVLKVVSKQAKYLKSLPLHSSQQVVSEDEHSCLLRLRVAPNYELIQKILSLGDQATVVEPAVLADEIRNRIAARLKNYGG